MQLTAYTPQPGEFSSPRAPRSWRMASTSSASSTFNSTTTSLAEPKSSSHSHSKTIVALAGTIGALCVVATVFTLALLFWRRRKRRVLRSQQIAIRRMTMVGPLSSPTTAASNSVHEQRLGFFGNRSISGAREVEMTTRGRFERSNNEVGLPWASLPAPVHQRQMDRVGHERGRVFPSSNATDVASLFSTKQSDVEDIDRMVLVDGVYVLALEREADINGEGDKTL